MRRLLAVAAVGAAILALGAANVRAAYISLDPSEIWRSIPDPDPTVTFAVNLNMAGETTGVAYADVFITLDDSTLFEPGSLIGQVDAASSPFEYLTWNVNGQGDQISFHATSAVFNPVPTPTGTEVFHLGDLTFEHTGLLGNLSLLLDLDQTSIATINLALEYVEYSLDNPDPLVGQLTVLLPGGTPEPTGGALLLLGLLALACLRIRSAGA